MHRSVVQTLLLAFAVSAFAGGLRAQQVVIDGKLDDAVWQQVPAEKLSPVEPGVPEAMGGQVRAFIAGGYLYLGAELPEPSGQVMARSMGFDPYWEGGERTRNETVVRRYTYGALDGEDFIRFVIRSYTENKWMLQVGPLGAYTVRWSWIGNHQWFLSLPYKCDRFLVATSVGKHDWTVEAAIPLEQIGSPQPGDLQVVAERNRARRPTMAQEWWRWPSDKPSGAVPELLEPQRNLPAPELQAPALGNNEPPIKVGFSKNVPDLKSAWDSPAWENVPAWTLRRNEAFARLPLHRTEVKMIQDGDTLAVLAKCDEPGRVISRATERDGPVANDDSFQVYLTTSGSYYVQYAVNPAGTVLDATGHQGSLRLSRPYPTWNSPVRAAAWQTQGEWFARLDLPLPAIARAMREDKIPRHWRILLVRNRRARDGEIQETSVLPVTQTDTPFCPARYRHLDYVAAEPSQLPKPPLPPEQTGALASLPNVFSPEQRKELHLPAMLSREIKARMAAMIDAEGREWDQVKTVSDWEHFRDTRLNALKAALGKFPPQCPLDTRVASEFHGDGYRRQNIAYQSQPGLWVTANLYLPAEPRADMPGMIILHSLHAPKTQFELQDMGIIWARAGCAVLVIDQIGYGERFQNRPWSRTDYASRYIMGEQLYLIGSNLMTWMVQDVERGVDVLLGLPNIDKNNIIAIGAVAGGGDPAAVAAALDPKITAVIPYNFGVVSPLTNGEWEDWSPIRVLRRSVSDQFLPWLICASVAPRYFIFAHEIAWTVGRGSGIAPGIGDLGEALAQNPAWIRYQKVWSLYHAGDHLTEAHGIGPFPSPGEAENIAPEQRESLYPTLERWFGIPIPLMEMKATIYTNLQRKPMPGRRPVEDLTVLTPAVSSELQMRTLHEIAHEEGEREVKAAREKLSGMSPADRREWLRSAWAQKLGDVEPIPNPKITPEWTRPLPEGTAEAVAIETEPGIEMPVLLLLPSRKLNSAAVPVVIAVAQGGKERFLADRSNAITGMLGAGIAICLPDVRGTGETAPDSRRDPDSEGVLLSTSELMMGSTLLGKRLKDLRTVLIYLENRHDIDAHRIGIWGDSFTAPNPAGLLVDEQPQWQVGPQIEDNAEPLGGQLAVLGALYESNVKTVAVHGGLVSFLSMLDDSFIYVPEDAEVPGSLEIGDIADLAAAAAPRPLLMEGTVNGRDQTVPDAELKIQLGPIYGAYEGTGSGALSIHAGEATDLAAWFRSHLR